MTVFGLTKNAWLFLAAFNAVHAQFYFLGALISATIVLNPVVSIIYTVSALIPLIFFNHLDRKEKTNEA